MIRKPTRWLLFTDSRARESLNGTTPNESRGNLLALQTSISLKRQAIDLQALEMPADAGEAASRG